VCPFHTLSNDNFIGLMLTLSQKSYLILSRSAVVSFSIYNQIPARRILKFDIPYFLNLVIIEASVNLKAGRNCNTIIRGTIKESINPTTLQTPNISCKHPKGVKVPVTIHCKWMTFSFKIHSKRNHLTTVLVQVMEIQDSCRHKYLGKL